MIAGVDLSSRAVDVVLLEEDTDRAYHHRRRIDLQPGDALTRIRRVRDALPARTAWNDSVTFVAIEEPFARGNMKGQVPILMAIGAVLACLPADLELVLLRADDWRRTCQLPIRGARADLKKAAINFARDHWANQPPVIDDNAADAFAIAWAARDLHDIRDRARRAA